MYESERESRAKAMYYFLTFVYIYSKERTRGTKKIKIFQNYSKFSQGTICEWKTEISIKIFWESWKQVGSSKIPKPKAEN